MGDVHAETSPPSADALGLVYGDYKSHASRSREETGLAVLESVRSRHPDLHVTVVDVAECDFIEYAKAGHASITHVWDGGNFLGRRRYKAPKSRLETGLGSLGESVDFGLYRMGIGQKEWSFYLAKWRNPFQPSFKRIYILSKEVDEHGHSLEVDDLILTVGKWTSELHEELYVFDDGDWTKSSQMFEAVQTASWDDVIIDPTMKQTLINDVHSFFDSRHLFEEYNVPWKRGIILHGTPGCGKTISIKALMNSLDKRSPSVASLYVKSLKSCNGPQYSVKEIFAQARTMAPCMLVFEDLDSLIVQKVRSYFLNEVDGLEDNNGILMVGSTNHLELLDPGISKRPSRFDRKYHYALPGERERILYSEYWKKKLERNSKIDFDPEICKIIAKLTEGFSFAYMKELFVQTLLSLVGGRGVDETTLDHELDEPSVIVEKTEAATGNHSAEQRPTGSLPTLVTPEGKRVRAPEVEIPDHLKDNRLLKVLRQQFIALYKDMDNSSSVTEPTSKVNDPSNQDESDDEAGFGERMAYFKQQERAEARAEADY